jgi:membrane protein
MYRWFKSHVWPVVARTWHGWQRDDGFLLSAAMAYSAAFSLFPLVLVLIAILGVVLRIWPQAAQSAPQMLLKALSEKGGIAGDAGPWLAEQLQALLAGVEARAGLGGPIGAATLLIAAIGMFIQFDYIFDRIWNIRPGSKSWLVYLRDVLWDRVSAFLMLLAVGVLLLAVFLANMVLAGIRPYVVDLPGGASAWDLAQVALTLVTNALLFGIVYKVLPKTRVRWPHALAGGLFVSVVWVIGQRLLVSFVIGANYSAYGVVGSFIAIMLWLYYVSAIVFLGAELVQALGHEAPLSVGPAQKPQ